MKNQRRKRISGFVEVSKASEFNLSKEGLYQHMRENNFEKVGPGMYVSPDELGDDLLVLHKRCPNGVFSHDEALYHHGLIDTEPTVHTITVYSGYNAMRLVKSGYKISYVNKLLLDIGKQMITNNFGNEIPMYDLERTLVDLARNRSQFEIQDFIAALKTYAKRPDKNLSKLAEYSKAFRVENILRGYLEVLL